MHAPDSYRHRAELLIAARRGNGDPALVKSVADRDTVIHKIHAQAKRRRYALKIQQKIDRALESYVRINYTDWQPGASEADREKSNKLVKDLIARARALITEAKTLEWKANELHAANDLSGAEELRARKRQLRATTDLDHDLLLIVEMTDDSRAPADEIRNSAEKIMEQLVKQLPVAQWIKKSVHGIGLPGLALIVAEAAALDREAGRVVGLDGYPNPAKLWKRLGYAPYDNFAGSTWKRETWRPRALTKQEWIEHPFSGPRYAAMYVLSNWLVNHQWISAKKTDTGEGQPTGHYGEIYAARRKHCDITHPDWSDEHRRKDGLRVAFKAFLVDLWEEWIDTAFLGQSAVDDQNKSAEIAAVGQSPSDTQSTVADSGTSLSQDAGDVQPTSAENAAVGQGTSDLHSSNTDDDTKSRNLGQPMDDAQKRIAEIAAAGHKACDAQTTTADGSPSSRAKTRKAHGRGHQECDAQRTVAATAAASQRPSAAHAIAASGGPKSKTKAKSSRSIHR